MCKGGISCGFVGLPDGGIPVQPGNSPRLGMPKRPRSRVDVIFVPFGGARVENSRSRVRAGVQDHYKRNGDKERFCFLHPPGDAHVLQLHSAGCFPADAVRVSQLHS